MNTQDFSFAGAALRALPSGALWWPERQVLVVSDLHLGKSERIARRNGALLPPYETTETLSRLEADLAATKPDEVICLGDSFDDPAASRALPAPLRDRIALAQSGRRWIWVEGNHDPGPLDLVGQQATEWHNGPLRFRHIAEDGTPSPGEVSGHYHPKCSLQLRGGRRVSRACFLLDATRLILPAYGAYTGGLHCHSAPLSTLMGADARAILIGPQPCMVPMPRG
ncbi:ligase-associated DNA damage response endonuclease PdeM [Dinoroseobacter sp. S375]|uniref:ligase-associated DNA damage response endonuclease PdeM n=1 Tax=Dinoroseobacter sp. S375 TaxID=3415136 RepID=UPI003C7C22D7